MADPTNEPNTLLTVVASAAGALASAFAGWRILRTSNSNASVSEASNEANIEAINTYQKMVSELREDKKAADERAKVLQDQLNQTIGELAKATAKLEVATGQIDDFKQEISLLRAEIRTLRGLPA